MKTLPEKFRGKYISFETDDEAWRIAKILEECGYEWGDDDRPGDKRIKWNKIRVLNYRKNFYISSLIPAYFPGDYIEDFTAQEFFEEMEGTTEATQKLKVGDRVWSEEYGVKGTVKCVHGDDICIDRDDGKEGCGCEGSWHAHQTYLWDLVKEEEREEKIAQYIPDCSWTIGQVVSQSAPNRVSIQLTPTPMCEEKSILQKIKALATPEPERTLQEAELMNEDNSLTHDGKVLLEQLVLEDYKDKMKDLVDRTKPKKKGRPKKA